MNKKKKSKKNFESKYIFSDISMICFGKHRIIAALIFKALEIKCEVETCKIYEI